MNFKRKKKNKQQLFMSTLSVVYVPKCVCWCVCVHAYFVSVGLSATTHGCFAFWKYGQHGFHFPKLAREGDEKGEERQLAWSERIQVGLVAWTGEVLSARDSVRAECLRRAEPREEECEQQWWELGKQICSLSMENKQLVGTVSWQVGMGSKPGVAPGEGSWSQSGSKPVVYTLTPVPATRQGRLGSQDEELVLDASPASESLGAALEEQKQRPRIEARAGEVSW